MNPGEWEEPHIPNWPSDDDRHYAIHMIHLPTDEIMVWGRRTTEELVVGVRCHLWDRDAYTVTQVIHEEADIFCAGHAQMGDGRIVAAGGGYPGGFPFPPRETARFERSPDQWKLLPHAHFGRWYPTMTTLPDGRPMMFAGWYEVISGFNNINATIPEYYDPVHNHWVLMHEAERTQRLYPMMFVLPDGNLFDAGPNPDNTRILNTLTWEWGPALAGVPGGDSHGSVAMYAPGKIIKSGGENPAVDKTGFIDMTAPTPAWSAGPDMHYRRRNHNLVVLPDQTVLAVGGNLTGQRQTGKRQAELMM